MRQVLDVIELVEKADEVEGSEESKVVWRLKRASTNSPFTVEAQGWSKDPAVSVDVRAARAKRTAREAIAGLLISHEPPDWMDGAALRTAKRLLERNLNGIGQTDLRMGDDPIQIFPATAQIGVISLEKALIDEKLSAPNLRRTEFGSFEGEIIAATRHYQNPALVIRERLTGDRITCVLSPDIAQQVGPAHSWTEIWAGRRVMVGGALHYSTEGQIAKADVDALSVVDERIVDLNELRELDITGGMSAADFLNLIRGADNG
ncbi:hypothetical protein BVIR_11 [Blastochloris viridis]|uniref:Uncharacterized protein n=2 Tax=Blastochloris viridis TaxID=1079 RepID=A0A0P0IQF8_BLAVI|nr:hypothetical protein BVIR_11 [Blastochloris viridis]CUU43751.1 hypothetical protein BVIRIDIS_27770 [Blastochloris viridis]